MINDFADDVIRGLSASPKFLSSKYFYDDEGSRLFQRIMKLPEYYLTRVEHEIFQTQASLIFDAFADGVEAFDVIELGAGDGSKTAVLIEHFLRHDFDFTYAPIDISSEAVNALTSKFHAAFPTLRIDARTGDYFEILETLKSESTRRKVIMFLGSNVGNFSDAQAVEFFAHLRHVMNPQDILFIGFDLHKDPRTILRAYDDSAGVTSKFNLNLLTRINRDLGANFDVAAFTHYASYHPIERAARSFLISQKSQTVYIGALQQSFEFAQWEPIFMEISQKYGFGMIERLAARSGFAVARNFSDRDTYYTNSLWRI